ncbi:MAG: hypothetical protein KC656_21580 [Myxococcales bacterium]|nr:hypothetical protein [Myxococcales bacterium]
MSDFETIRHLETCADCRALADRIRREEAALHAHLDAWQAVPPPEKARVWRVPWLLAAMVLLAIGATLATVVRSLPEPEVPPSSGILLQLPEGPSEPAPRSLTLRMPIGGGEVIEALDDPREISQYVRYERVDSMRIAVIGVSGGATTLTIDGRPVEVRVEGEPTGEGLRLLPGDPLPFRPVVVADPTVASTTEALRLGRTQIFGLDGDTLRSVWIFVERGGRRVPGTAPRPLPTRAPAPSPAPAPVPAPAPGQRP